MASDRSEYFKNYQLSDSQKKRKAEVIQKHRRARRVFIDEIKNVPCAACTVIYPPYCMDFHHIDPATKAFSIGAEGAGIALQRLLDEIDKCVVLCAVCHRMVEAGDLILEEEYLSETV